MGTAGAPADLLMAWRRAHGSGRVFYTALGHREEVWQDARPQQHLIGAAALGARALILHGCDRVSHCRPLFRLFRQREVECMRVLCVVPLLLVLVPFVASAQSSPSSVSIQAAAGPTVTDTGHHVSAAVGYSPTSRVTLFVDVQRTHLSSRLTRHEGGFSAFRGGTMTAVSGEVRVGLWPVPRVTPYVLGGLGVGVSRPNVNPTFPDRVTNDARFMFFGGGVHLPLRERLSVFGDARMLVGTEAGEMLAMAPVRVGLAWRF